MNPFVLSNNKKRNYLLISFIKKDRATRFNIQTIFTYLRFVLFKHRKPYPPLNKTAGIIVKGLLADITSEKIAENILIAFDVSYEVVFNDVQLFVQQLMRKNGVDETSSHE